MKISEFNKIELNSSGQRGRKGQQGSRGAKGSKGDPFPAALNRIFGDPGSTGTSISLFMLNLTNQIS